MTVRSVLITQKNIDAVIRVLEQQKAHKIVAERREKNVNVPGSPPNVSREILWHAHMLCLLTSQQPSSEGDPVSILLNEDPFPLSYRKCAEVKSVRAFVRQTLYAREGIRFREERIPGMAEQNFKRLEAGGWDEVKQFANGLRKRRARPHNWSNYELDHPYEEKAADYMDDYQGFGPKQSRNFWQALGLTRYVSVLDSRVKKWCVQNLEGDWARFEISRRRDYTTMADTIRELCRRANVLPCMLDAAVFSKFERDPRSASWCRW